MKKASETEAIKIFILPEKHGCSYKVDPPASLWDKRKSLPFYGERGTWIKTEGELLLWIEKIVQMKLHK